MMRLRIAIVEEVAPALNGDWIASPANDPHHASPTHSTWGLIIQEVEDQYRPLPMQISHVYPEDDTGYHSARIQQYNTGEFVCECTCQISYEIVGDNALIVTHNLYGPQRASNTR